MTGTETSWLARLNTLEIPCTATHRERLSKSTRRQRGWRGIEGFGTVVKAWGWWHASKDLQPSIILNWNRRSFNHFSLYHLSTWIFLYSPASIFFRQGRKSVCESTPRPEPVSIQWQVQYSNYYVAASSRAAKQLTAWRQHTTNLTWSFHYRLLHSIAASLFVLNLFSIRCWCLRNNTHNIACGDRPRHTGGYMY